MRIYIIIYTTFISLLLITGCQNKNSLPDAYKGTIDRFDLELYSYPDLDMDKRKEFSQRYSDVIAIIPSIENNADSSLLKYSQSYGIRLFTNDIMARFTAQDSIERILFIVAENLKTSLPHLRDRKVYGIVSTFNQSIILNDSILLLGLNHYLGSDYPGYEYFDTYIRHSKTPEHLPYDFAEAVIKSDFKYDPSPEHPDLLSRMLYEGAVMYIINETMPNSTESELLGYSTAEIGWLQRNEKSLWEELVSRKMLYSTDPLIATKLMSPAPHSYLLSPEAPGRAARYLGYRIIKSYMKHNPDTPLPKLLSPEIYNNFSTLVNAEYKP